MLSSLLKKMYEWLIDNGKLLLEKRRLFAAWVKSKAWYERCAIRGLELFLFFILFLVIVDLNLFWLFGKSPRIREINNPKYEITSELYSADGKLLAKYFNKNREPVSYREISPLLIKTLIAVEDNRFYQHNGIDMKASLAIFWYAAQGERRGGSTITQQLVKNLFKTRDNYSKGLFGHIPGVNTIIYKTKEWINALKIEWYYSKEEILTMYLNTVDFGSNTYGIKTAAKTFFSTSPMKLTAPQCATLVGLLKAPTYYSPIVNKKRSIERRNLILDILQEQKIISFSEAYDFKKQPLQLLLNFEENYNGEALYFRGAVAKYLKEWLDENGLSLYEDGLKIYTTIDSRMQTYAEESVKENMMRIQHTFNNVWSNQNPWVDDKGQEIPGFIDNIAKQTRMYSYLKEKYGSNSNLTQYYLNKPRKTKVYTWNGIRDTMISTMDSIRHHLRFLHAGFVTMDPNNGQIKCWVGGINYKHFKYDHVKQSKRQPGSTFKMFTYAAAIDNGYGPCDKLVDKSITIKYTENGEEKTWHPQNITWVFTGHNMSLKYAFAKSVNAIAVQLTENLGWDKVIAYAHKMGIKSELQQVPSVCLGTSDVSLLELLTAYCPAVNSGYAIEPMLVTRIEDHEGNIIKEFTPVRKQIFTEENAFLMLQLLLGGMTEPGATTQALFSYDLFRSKIQFGGKTGTSQNLSDGWFIGVTPKLVGGAWVGGQYRSIHFKDNNHGEGCKTALPIFGRFMEKVLADPDYDSLKVAFQKPVGKISKEYTCHTYLPKTDTLFVDSTAVWTDEVFE